MKRALPASFGAAHDRLGERLLARPLEARHKLEHIRLIVLLRYDKVDQSALRTGQAAA